MGGSSPKVFELDSPKSGDGSVKTVFIVVAEAFGYVVIVTAFINNLCVTAKSRYRLLSHKSGQGQVDANP